MVFVTMHNIVTYHDTWRLTTIKGRVVLSHFPLIMWASGHWHYERTLYSRRPLKRDRSFYLYGVLTNVAVLCRRMRGIDTQ